MRNSLMCVKYKKKLQNDPIAYIMFILYIKLFYLLILILKYLYIFRNNNIYSMFEYLNKI